MKRFFLSLLLVSAGFTGSIQAQQPAPDKTMDIIVHADFEPVQSVGLILSTQGARERPIVASKRVDADTLVLTISYPSAAPRDTMVTALVFAEDGTIAGGQVRPIVPAEPSDTYLDLPPCKPEPINEAALQGQLGVLENILRVRAQRRGVDRVRIAQIMSDKFLERLRRLEKGFGYQYTQELGPDLPPAELADRLNRILESVQLLKTSSAADEKSNTRTEKKPGSK